MIAAVECPRLPPRNRRHAVLSVAERAHDKYHSSGQGHDGLETALAWVLSLGHWVGLPPRLCPQGSPLQWSMVVASVWRVKVDSNSFSTTSS